MLVVRQRAPLEAVAASLLTAGGARGHAAGAAQTEQVQGVVAAALTSTGQSDMLVNNAGVVDAATPFLEMTGAEWETLPAA